MLVIWFVSIKSSRLRRWVSSTSSNVHRRIENPATLMSQRVICSSVHEHLAKRAGGSVSVTHDHLMFHSARPTFQTHLDCFSILKKSSGWSSLLFTEAYQVICQKRDLIVIRRENLFLCVSFISSFSLFFLSFCHFWCFAVCLQSLSIFRFLSVCFRFR